MTHPAGEYNYYLVWNTYDNLKIDINGDILDSIITTSKWATT